MQRHGTHNPGWSMGGVSAVLEHCFPHLRGRRDVYDQIVSDLQTDGLVGSGSFLHMTMTADGMFGSRTSTRGKAFLAFITAN